MTMGFRRLARLAALAAALLATIAVPGLPADAQEKPRTGGILTWFDYGDPGRLDVHTESPLVVQQATAGIYSGLLHRDPDDPTKIAPDLAASPLVNPPDELRARLHVFRALDDTEDQDFNRLFQDAIGA